MCFYRNLKFKSFFVYNLFSILFCGCAREDDSPGQEISSERQSDPVESERAFLFAFAGQLLRIRIHGKLFRAVYRKLRNASQSPMQSDEKGDAYET